MLALCCREMLAVRGLARLAPVQVAARYNDALFLFLEMLPDIFILTLENSVCFSSSRAQHTLPDLPYDYNALEPVTKIMILLMIYH